MKTPREMLLAKHQAASPKLDEVRREAVNDCRRRREESLNDSSSLHASHSAFDQSLLTSAPTWKGWPSLAMKLLVKAWQELFVPCRRVWLGLAVVWCVIVGLAAREDAPVIARGPAPKAEDVLAALQEKREMLRAELGLARVEAEAVRPPDPVIRPRSERARPVAMA
jgi:hypothetical protein